MPIRHTRRFSALSALALSLALTIAGAQSVGQFWICKRNRTRSDGCGSREREG